jgi:chemotaxis protein methyltransferase CheR
VRAPLQTHESLKIEMLLKAIFKTYGYDFRHYAPVSIRRRVMAAFSKSRCKTLGEFQDKIVHDPAFFSTVLEDLTVVVTEFFRDPQIYPIFRSEVLPVLRTYPFIRIWHAGCATGEEAYASAITLSEEQLYNRSLVYATDINPTAIEQAKQGIYSTRDLALFTDNYIKCGGKADFTDYYTTAYERIVIKESLRPNLMFFQHNLVTDHPFVDIHMIFCRNVLIYFGSELKAKILQKFRQSLLPGGFLCLGINERLPQEITDFTPFSLAAHIYRYEGNPQQ